MVLCGCGMLFTAPPVPYVVEAAALSSSVMQITWDLIPQSGERATRTGDTFYNITATPIPSGADCCGYQAKTVTEEGMPAAEEFLLMLESVALIKHKV